MTTKTKIALLSVAGLTVLLLVAGYAWAAATETPIEGTMTITVVGNPDRYWVDDEGIEHYRGLPYVAGFPSGDLEGTGSGAVNINLDPMGNGDQSGTTTIAVTWRDLSGTFEGRLSGTVTNGVADCNSVLHGASGDFVGMKMKMSYSLDYATMQASYQASILDPHGE